MATFFLRKNSEYYYINVYDPNRTGKKQVKMCSKIKATDADLQRFKETGSANLKGNKEIKSLVNDIQSSISNRTIESKLNIKLQRSIMMADAFNDYMFAKPGLKKDSQYSYQRVTDLFRSICGNKYVSDYTNDDFKLFFNHLVKSNYSKATQSSYLKRLHVLWNYFIESNYAKINIIKKIKDPAGIPEPIPADDLNIIFDFYKNKIEYIPKSANADPNLLKQQYFFISIMRYSGLRQSSIIAMNWEDIDLINEVIRVNNIKGDKKYPYPLHSKLKEIFSEMGIKKNGKIFSYKGTDSLNFWDRDLKEMVSSGKIRKKYQMYSLKDTFASELVNAGVNIGTVQTLLNHYNIKTTKKHYTSFENAYLKGEVDRTFK